MRWIGVHGTQEYDAAGRPVRLVGMTQDVTDRKEREADRERALSEAEEQADRDPLTDVLNHRAFQRQFADEADRARRTGTALAVVVLDVDDFPLLQRPVRARGGRRGAAGAVGPAAGGLRAGRRRGPVRG